jgi:glutamate-1-semialdehyde 2,1-aminomutase
MLNTEKSKRLYERAAKVYVEGVNSPSRGCSFYKPHPIFVDYGRGGRIYDVDGNEYIDLMLGYSVLVLGHAHPEIVEAYLRAANQGTHYATGSELEVEVGEKLCQLIPCADKIRFANSGTEATMAAIRLARGFTGRNKFIKFEGHYHGWYDDFLVNTHAKQLDAWGTRRGPVHIPDSSGLPPESLSNTIVCPWNDIDLLADNIKKHHGQIAAVITEPIASNIGCIPPKPGYLENLRQITADNDILLIFDEVVTGFRYAPGGCQEYYGVTPDIATFGKAFGAGLPIGLVAGNHEIMEAFTWGKVLHFGTFNATRLAVEVVNANVDVLTRNGNSAIKHLYETGDKIIAGYNEIFKRRKIPAIVQGFGPMFQIYFTEKEEIVDFRDYCSHVDLEKYNKFANELRNRGVYIPVSNGLHQITCISHNNDDIEKVLAGVDDVLKEF